MTLKRELGELKSLGVFGICKGAYTIIFSSKKILYQIILAYFLFLTLITLTEIQLTSVLFGEFPLQVPAFESQTWSSFKDEVLNWVASQFTHEWTWYWLLKFAYFLIHVFHYTLFSSAVVYTAACIYTAKPINFRNIMGRAPKAMVNLFITNLCSLVAFLGYNFAALALLLGFVRLTKYDTAQVFSVIGIIALPITYLISLPYIWISWRLACFVSVLEDMYGFKAMIKSFSLIEGKVLCAGIIFVMMKRLEIGTQQGWMALVEYGKFEGVSKPMMIWILYNPLLEVEILVGFVVQTVIYLVCKSYHHESIDKSRSADHLEVIMVDYALLNNNEQFTNHEFFVGSKSD